VSLETDSEQKAIRKKRGAESPRRSPRMRKG
jgi:hypothetical protein